MQTLSGNQRPDLLTSLMNMPLVLCLPGETPKSGPNLVCFCAFWLPHVLRAATACTFSTCQLPKVVLCAFWLPNVLRATTARTFWTSQLPKMVRAWCVLYILTSKFASRHNGVQLFISHLASWLRTRRFSEPTFRPSGATNHWKNTVFRDFPTFSRTWIFFLLTLSLLWSSLFYSSLLSDSSRLCFSSVHIVGSLTSKLPYLPSIIIQHVLPYLALSCQVACKGRKLCLWHTWLDGQGQHLWVLRLVVLHIHTVVVGIQSCRFQNWKIWFGWQGITYLIIPDHTCQSLSNPHFKTACCVLFNSLQVDKNKHVHFSLQCSKEHDTNKTCSGLYCPKKRKYAEGNWEGHWFNLAA